MGNINQMHTICVYTLKKSKVTCDTHMHIWLQSYHISCKVTVVYHNSDLSSSGGRFRWLHWTPYQVF